MRVTSPLAKAPAPKRTGRFFFDGLSTPVRASVAHQDAAGMTLRQELPFLQLHGRLRDEEGREGSLENVSVMVRNGVPSLVLDIRYEGGRNDATVPFLMESTRAMRATHSLLRKAEAAECALPVEANPRSASADEHPLFNPANVPSAPRKARRDETLPYGLETRNDAGDIRSRPPVELPRVEIPSVEDLMRVTGVPSAPLRRRGGANGWWARLWQRLMLRLFALI